MIRFADLKDFDRVMKLMINFANSSPLQAHHNPDFDYRRIQHLLSQLTTNGCVLVGEDRDGEIQGILIAGISEDPWLPHVKTLRELMWWVEPSVRNSTMGYKLLLKYIQFGEQMQRNHIIDAFTLTNMTQSPDFDLEKRGWAKVETNYVYRGK